MALATTSRPCPVLPVRRSKAILNFNPKSAIQNSINQQNPEKRLNLFYNSSLKTTCKTENWELFSFPNNATTEAILDTNENPSISEDLVVVKREEMNNFWGIKWNLMDIATGGSVIGMHLLALFGPFYFNWSAFWVAFGLYVVLGIFGINISYHRNLTHRSFKLPKWLEYTFAYLGVQTLQGSPIDWVSTHRYHHQFVDSEKDPHSPITKGFWYSHMTWLFDTNVSTEKFGGANNVKDLKKQPFYKFIKKTYILHPIGLGILLYVLGGLPFLVWGMGVRITWFCHVTWLVNSVCHIWGNQPWNTGDLSTNNWWVAVLAFGEGWHNNHHAFEYSARHGLEWWQIDMTWYFLKFLQAIGLATDVKLPNESQKQKMAFNN